jgi:polysaccharide transporter, PST family
MLGELIEKFTTGNKKRLFGNFASLSLLQGTNLLLPLITFPYLVRILGIEKFGLVAFALATVAYFEILTDYGFDLSATRQVSIHRDDRLKLTSIYNSVLIIKGLLSVLSFLLLTILVFSFQKFSVHFLVYYLTFGRVLGKSIFPVWFFQGMERMKFTTYLNILAKAIFTVAIFLFVKTEDDLLLVPAFNSLGFLAAGVVALVQIRFGFGIEFKAQPWSVIRDQLVDGWYIFLSRVYVNIYTTTNIFLLGVLTNNVVVGYYAVAAKIIEAITSLFIPANNTLYPYMSKLFHENAEKFYRLVKKVIVLYGVVAMLLFMAALLFGKDLIVLVKGSFDDGVYGIYSILVWKILLSPFGPFLTLIFINQGRQANYLAIVNYTFIANMILVPLSILWFSGTGMAAAVLAVGIFHIILFIGYGLIPKNSVSL